MTCIWITIKHPCFFDAYTQEAKPILSSKRQKFTQNNRKMLLLLAHPLFNSYTCSFHAFTCLFNLEFRTYCSGEQHKSRKENALDGYATYVMPVKYKRNIPKLMAEVKMKRHKPVSAPDPFFFGREENP